MSQGLVFSSPKEVLPCTKTSQGLVFSSPKEVLPCTKDSELYQVRSLHGALQVRETDGGVTEGMSPQVYTPEPSPVSRAVRLADPKCQLFPHTLFWHGPPLLTHPP